MKAAKLLWSVSDTNGDLSSLLSDRRGKKFDTVLAADCLFFEAFHDDLIHVLEHSLKSQGMCFMLQPPRGQSMNRFIRKVEMSESLQVIFVTEDYNDEVPQNTIISQTHPIDALAHD